MEFLMNGTAAEAAITGRTIGDVLAELDERAEAMGAIIVEVDLNGRSLSPDELAEACAGSADAPGTISLVAESAAGLKARGLESLLELVEAITQCFGIGRRLPDYPEALCVEIENEPVYAPEHIEQYRQFTSVVTLTFEVIK